MKSLIKNGMTLLCLAVIIAVALPAEAKKGKDKKPKDWQIADTSLQGQLDAIEGLPDGETLGDILFWNGSGWQLIPAPPPSRDAPPPKLTLCDGVLTWSSTACDTDQFVRTGVFLDGPVYNIDYETKTPEGVTSQVGKTNDDGEYDYLPGETVTFFIGKQEFPTVLATGVVTPLELAGSTDTTDPEVVNMIRLLQTLDQDGDPDNGISITDAAKVHAATDDFIEFDFNDSVVVFQESPAVMDLITNAGQEEEVYELIPVDDAIAHFAAELDEINEVDVVGMWSAEDSDSDLQRIIFFENLTYLHLEVIDGGSVDDYGMEWGTYSRDAVDGGRMTLTQIFDSNGELGLSRFAGETDPPVLFTTVSGDELIATIATFDENDDSTIEDTILFRREPSYGILGSWVFTASDDITLNELLVFVFSDDGTYVHAEYDPDDYKEVSGMEWGTYTWDASSRLMTITGMLFDENGDTGLNPELFGDGPPFLYLNLDNDMLTIEVDFDGDGTMEETINFERLPKHIIE
jgi:hypothetical protein